MGSVYGIVIGALVKQRPGSMLPPQPTWIGRPDPFPKGDRLDQGW
jgi:hypothetical protein